MKKSLLNVAVFTAAVIGTAGFSACATTKSAETRNKEVAMKSFNGNPWELVYDGAITENVKGKVNIRPVTYDLNGIAISADASYQGASGGEPRLRDWPANRINDVSGMVDYLIQLPKVDSARIGSLGICGGGGYTLAASQTDKRIRAVATLSMFNSGRVRRNGFGDKQIATVQERLLRASNARNEELKGNILYEGFLPPHKDDAELRKIMESQPEGLYKDGIDYYGLSYRHPRATGSYTTESFIKLMAFDVEDRMELINQPLLMIAGSAADTLYMSEDAFKKASGTADKELYLIDGASHIKTYWKSEYVAEATSKLSEFFGKRL